MYWLDLGLSAEIKGAIQSSRKSDKSDRNHSIKTKQQYHSSI